jgi:hypothetical protein
MSPPQSALLLPGWTLQPFAAGPPWTQTSISPGFSSISMPRRPLWARWMLSRRLLRIDLLQIRWGMLQPQSCLLRPLTHRIVNVTNWRWQGQAALPGASL